MTKEKMRQDAHNLALIHDPFMKRRSSKQLAKTIESDMNALRHFVRELSETRLSCTQPAEEWLLDNAEFIESEVLTIKKELSPDLLRALPHISKTGQLRMYAICAAYLEQCDGRLNEETFMSYVQAYQEVSVLLIAEVWAIPLMLRIGIIRQLAAMMETIKERRAVCTLVDRVLSSIPTADLTPERLKLALEEAGQNMPLSGSLTAHLVQHLRERADDMANVGEWLLCKLELGPESLDSILSLEYQLQATYHMTTGNLIDSLRLLSRRDWSEAFERLSVVEQTLNGEQAGDYPLLDFYSRDTLRLRVEKLARRMAVPENLVASQAVLLANGVYEQECADRDNSEVTPDISHAHHPSRASNVAYYLLEAAGLSSLRKALKMCGKTRPLPEIAVLHRATGTYFNMLGSFFIVGLLIFSLWVGWNSGMGLLGWLVTILVLAIPVSEWAITAVHWCIEMVKPPLRLLRYDFSKGVPVEAATMVVIPVIWSTIEEVESLTERLELHYLANRGANLHFALLGDFKDAISERLPEDRVVLEAAISAMNRLNATYRNSSFYLFQRKRKWNPSEEVWMGWERKRGKLVEFVDMLKGSNETSYESIPEDTSMLGQIKYIITLDADTQLPLESAHRMIGTMHLPYNRPRLNATRTRIVEGYGVLQPRIGMSHEASQQSRLSALWSAEPGIDPYAFAVFDPYQDSLGESVFTGKGIFEVEAFHTLLCERIPENRVLSHDLLEGGFLRAGLLSDIELIDDHPVTFSAHQKRLHRWVRGDWQLILWLLRKVNNRNGALLPVDLSILTRWQIVDNLRRSLLQPGLMLILLLSVIILPGSPMRWFMLVLATLLIPVLKQCFNLHTWRYSRRNLLVSLGHVAVTLITLPYQSIMLSHAIVVTLYRLLISKRHLLEWTSQAEVDRSSKRNETPVLLGLYGGYVLIALFLIAAIWRNEAVVQGSAIAVSLLWLTAPLVIRWLDQGIPQEAPELSANEKAELTQLAREIWAFYEDYVTEKDSWLPPDNVQIEPHNGVAHRTSPTNIGLYLNCALAARDFDFISTADLLLRLEQTLEQLDRMEKWEGHLYNWYDTETLAPLSPQFVSTVDSGNLVACLMTVKEGVLEWLKMTAEPSELERGHSIVNTLEQFIIDTNFRALYDEQSKLFSLGYNVAKQQREDVLYDLMASEARQASFIAIALGQVSVSHWNVLGRTMTKVGDRRALLSWTGTMFEYLMPWLLMRTYRNTIWDSTYRAIVARQIDYAQQRGIPFGISESGYYAFDYQMNYQYRAFGVPGLGFKRGLEQDLVVAPYATILALPFAANAGLEALRQIEQLGGRGKYGYYEALDFTRKRLPDGRSHMVIRSFMSHHLGMSLLALSNVLQAQSMINRFHNDRRVRAAELILQERMPSRPALIDHQAMHRVHEPYTRTEQHPAERREFVNPHTEVPEVCVLSNGTFTTVVTNSGSGLSRFEGLAISRWREDPVRDPWGSYVYVRDVTADKLWSPSYQPCRVQSEQQGVRFELDRATFTRVDDEMETTMEICVSPEAHAEVRRITLKNKASEAKVLEVTTFVELALAYPIADDAHPAFSKLFIRTDYDETENCLVAGRRAREAKDKTFWGAHALIVDNQAAGQPEFDTDRSSFIGRGHSLAEPQAIRTRLSGKLGSVADPVFVMRRRVSVAPGEQVQLFAITSVADTKEEAVHIVSQFKNGQTVERSFQLAWNRVRIELRNLHLSQEEAMEFQRLFGRILYTSPLRKERTEHILTNTEGQSSLWAFGISGDRPVGLVRIERHSHLPFVAKLLTGHEYLRRLGLLFELIILNESTGGYYQDLQEALQRAAEQGVDRFGEGLAGVYVIPVNQLQEKDRALLSAVSRIELRAGGPSLKAQSRLPRLPKHPIDLETDVPAELTTWTTQVEKIDQAKQVDTLSEPNRRSEQLETSALQFFNGWGGFAAGGREYHIEIKQGKHLPAPWINVMANRNFGCIISELGTGYSWWRNSRECKITPWSNDTVLDPPGEIGFLRDEQSGEFWTMMPSVGADHPPYLIKHGQGFTSFEHERHGIAHHMSLFVPLEDSVKIMRVKLRNKSAERRQMSLTYYAEWVLGVQRQSNAPYIVTEWDESAQLLVARNQFQDIFREATAFLGIYDQAPASEATRLSWTADRHEFVGRNGLIEEPAALKRVSLSKRTGAQYDACGALQLKLTLEPDEEREVIILLGCTASSVEAANLARKYANLSTCEEAWQAMTAFWKHTLQQTVVSTPSPEMDVLLNGWFLYQTIACRMWARSAFYQAGGAYGYRDQLQDSLALLHTMPELTRAQVLLHASHQYEEGDVQHWWHEETERGIRTLFSDDLLWLPYVTSRYVEQTGDVGILQEVVPYITSEPLQEGEHERYEETVQSAESGTLYEHCVRAIDKALSRIGEHDLPLIGVGDWNDGMNLVGAEGRGESVWLGWFICVNLQRFSEYCMSEKDEERVAAYKQRREELIVALNEHGWDGQWYRRAFTDAGTWLGSIHNDECRIDAIAQSWSVISGGAPKDRALQAMQSFDRELVERELGIIRLLTPPFDESEPSPGYIQGYPPGIRENGAQYTHGVIWSVMAWCELGEGDKAFELFNMLNPINHTRTEQEVRRYVGEPYAMAADVYTAEPHKGQAGWTWYTGASSWMYQVGLEHILGLQRRENRLYINPCIPTSWPGFSATYRFGASHYVITVTRLSAMVEHAEIHSDEKGRYVALHDDGAEHQVTITI